MNAPPATQAEGGILTKPHDWGIYMVTAALKCASTERIARTYATADAAKHGILKTLNWFEANDKYDWPDFAGQHYSFDQVMRLRRVLVADIYNALQKAGNIKVGVPGTPDSNAGTRRRRRSSEQRRHNIKKRFLKRDSEIDEDAMSEASVDRGFSHEEGVHFLESIMGEIISRSHVDMEKHLKDGKSPRFVADLVHDELVEMWDNPLQEEGEHAQSLKERAEVWDQHKKSVPPVSSQRERTTTPRISSAAPKTSPVTVGKHAEGAAPVSGPSWDASSWTAANKTWANTNSIA